MPDLTEIAEMIAAEAALPKSSESDGQRAEGHSLKDLIDYYKFVASTQTGTGTTRKASAWARLSKARAITPGTEPL